MEKILSDETRSQLFWVVWLFQVALINTNFWWGLVTVLLVIVAPWRGGLAWLRLFLGLMGIAFIAIGLKEPLFPIVWIWQ